MTNEQIELGARALFELEKCDLMYRLAYGPEAMTWEGVAPVVRDRLRAQSRAVLTAALLPSGGDGQALGPYRSLATPQ